MAKRLILSFVIAVLISGCSNHSCQNTDTTFHCVKYLRNYDGDTITFKISGEHPIISDSIGVRVNGVDTPEIKTKNACEKQKAKEARDFVKERLSKAQRIDLKDVQRGKYFRIVANVIYNQKNLSEELLKNELAVPYDGGKKKKINWCLK